MEACQATIISAAAMADSGMWVGGRAATKAPLLPIPRTDISAPPPLNLVISVNLFRR